MDLQFLCSVMINNRAILGHRNYLSAELRVTRSARYSPRMPIWRAPIINDVPLVINNVPPIINDVPPVVNNVPHEEMPARGP